MLVWKRFTVLFSFFSLLLSSHYWLPVSEVWFGNQVVSIHHLSTPHCWKNMLESFDWVDTYSLAWQYPNILKVSVERKQAVAKTPNEQYISKEGFFFHLGAHQEDVPLLDMPKESIPQALMLMESMPNIASIKEHPSGTVEILYHSQNRVYLNDYEKPLYFDQILLKEKTINSKVLCDFRYKKYVNCH